MRVLILALSSLVAAGATIGGLLVAMNAASVEKPTIGLTAIEIARNNIERLAAGRAGERIAFLGDSTVVNIVGGDIPKQLFRELSRRRRISRPKVVAVSYPGMHPSDYYFLSGLIAEARPDQIVLAFNLAAIGDLWRVNHTRPELAGWIPPRRLHEAALLPLHWLGVSLDRLLLYFSIVQLGGDPLWRAVRLEQARIPHGYESAVRWIEGSPQRGLSELRKLVVPGSNPTRMTPEALRRRYGPVLAGVEPDHPVLRMMGAAVSAYRSDGIRVIVYAIPTNVEYFARVGIDGEQGLRKSITNMRRAVEVNGGIFLDLHRLLPDRGFRDFAGHFTFEPPLDGPAMVARRLAPVVEQLARHTRRRRT